MTPATNRFAEVSLTWGGSTYTVPRDKIMELAEGVESIVSLPELGEEIKRGKKTIIAKAYAFALRYAGAKDVDQEEVYCALWDGLSVAEAIVERLQGILSMMIPPEALKALMARADEEGAAAARKANRRERRAASSSSRKRT